MDGSAATVLQAVGASLRSLLGPNRSAKMCVSEGEGGSNGLITTDSMQVLSALTDQIQHPAGHVIHSMALGHHGNHGCGVTGLVCLAASWSQQVAELRKLGVPLPVIFAVFEECLGESEAAISTLRRPLAEIREEYIRLRGGVGTARRVSLYSRHSRAPSDRDKNLSSGFLQYLGDQLCHGREQAMRLAVKAVLPQIANAPLDLRKVMSLQVVGVASQHSRVEGGVVCRLRQEMVGAVRRSEHSTLRVVVMHGDATENYTHRGTTRDVKISPVFRSCDLGWGSHDLGMESRDHWLRSWQQFLRKFCVGLLAVGGTVAPALYDHCLAEGIVVTSELSASHSHALCLVSGTRAIHYTSQILEEGAVGIVRARVVEGGWTRCKVHHPNLQHDVASNYLCSLQPALEEETCDVTTAILCGHTHSQTNILEHSLRNCLSRLGCVMSDVCAVRGGGWVEGRIAAIIRSTNKQFLAENRGSIPYGMRTGWLGRELQSPSGERGLIVEAFAAGFEDFAAAVLSSLGVPDDHFQALALVRELQTKSYQDNGEEGGAWCKVGVVFDAYSCKVSGWRAALSLVRTLSSVAFIQPTKI